MGLAISVGFLEQMCKYDEEGEAWIRGELASLNALLSSEGLPTFEEPERVDLSSARRHVGSFPYSFIHYLRRAQAWMRQRPGEPLVPVGDEGLAAYEDMIADEMCMMDSHLLGHSDCEGFYVPVRFDEPLLGDGVVGTLIGSSVRLHEEMIELAPFLDIELDENSRLSEEEAARVYELGEYERIPLYREYIVWLTLFELSRISVEQQSMIVFH